MSVEIRILLVIVSFVTLIWVLRKIRKEQMKIEESIFWILFSIIVFVISIFPQIPIGIAVFLNIISPVNFIFLLMLFVLIIKLFDLTLKIAKLESKLEKLVQDIAITNYENEKRG